MGGSAKIAEGKALAAKPRSRLSRVRRLQHQRASASCLPGKVECVGGEPTGAPGEQPERRARSGRWRCSHGTLLPCSPRTARSALARSSVATLADAPERGRTARKCPKERVSPLPRGLEEAGSRTVFVIGPGATRLHVKSASAFTGRLPLRSDSCEESACCRSRLSGPRSSSDPWFSSPRWCKNRPGWRWCSSPRSRSFRWP